MNATIMAIVATIGTIAIAAVAFSQKANTQQVLTAGGTAVSSIIGAAVSPITGNNQFGSSGGQLG